MRRMAFGFSVVLAVMGIMGTAGGSFAISAENQTEKPSVLLEKDPDHFVRIERAVKNPYLDSTGIKVISHQIAQDILAFHNGELKRMEMDRLDEAIKVANCPVLEKMVKIYCTNFSTAINEMESGESYILSGRSSDLIMGEDLAMVRIPEDKTRRMSKEYKSQLNWTLGFGQKSAERNLKRKLADAMEEAINKQLTDCMALKAAQAREDARKESFRRFRAEETAAPSGNVGNAPTPRTQEVRSGSPQY